MGVRKERTRQKGTRLNNINMTYEEALKIADTFLEYIKTGKKNLIRGFSLETIRQAYNLLPKSQSYDKTRQAMKERIGELRQRGIYIRNIAIGLFVLVVGTVFAGLILKSCEKYEIGLTDKQYKQEVMRELIWNTRATQFWIWCLRDKDWESKIDFRMIMLPPYLDFYNRKVEILKRVDDVALTRRIQTAYEDFKKVEKRVTGDYRQNIGGNIAFFSDVVNKGIAIVKEIGEDIGDMSYHNKPYLQENWNEVEVLEKISRDFIVELNRLEPVSGESATLAPWLPQPATK
jgi:hypothetical protein